jgi:putative membrane protein
LEAPLEKGVAIRHLAHVRSFLQRWLVTTAAVLVASQIVPGIRAETLPSLLAASLLLGILNAFFRPIMMILSLPLLLFTLGLFTLVINAILLLIVGKLVGSFHVAGFWSAFWGGVVISIVSFIANAMIGRPEKRPPASAPPPPQQRPPPPPGQGPVIDV